MYRDRVLAKLGVSEQRNTLHYVRGKFNQGI